MHLFPQNSLSYFTIKKTQNTKIIPTQFFSVQWHKQVAKSKEKYRKKPVLKIKTRKTVPFSSKIEKSILFKGYDR